MLHVRLAIIASLCAVPGCVSPDLDAGQVVQAAEPTQCDDDGCGGGNSPVINGVYFWSLHSFGLANNGVAIKNVTRWDGVAMTLIAEGDRLRGIHPVTHAPLADGVALVNTRINVSVNGAPYQIRISYVSPTFAVDEKFWVGSQARIEAYDFVFKPLFERDARERPLCNLANSDPMNPMIRAIVFTGDNYDPVSKEITLGALTNGWMNIACKDSAIYKMHEIGYTKAASDKLGIATSLDERHAMLNSWTMNACGNGTAFTKPGTKILLTESHNLLPATSPFQAVPITADNVEAIWGPDGARCLDTHRLATDPFSNDALRKAIATECGHELLSCESMVGDWDDHGYVITGAP